MRPIVKSAVALGLMLLVTGCDRVQKAARDLSGEDGDNGRPPATASHQATSHTASSSSLSSGAPAPAVAITDPSDSELGDWHIAMTAACAAGKAEHVAHYDINGDGLPDTVCWRAIRSKAYGNSVDIDARVTNGDHVQSAYMWLPADSHAAISICNADHVSVRQALWSQKDLDDKHWDGDHRVGLTVSDGACAPVHLFWPKDASGDEVDFTFERH